MNIRITLFGEPSSYKVQLEAVSEYIKKNTIKVNTTEFLGTTVGYYPLIKETPKGQGEKIQLESTYKKFHISCRKTKGGIYKFNIWNAV